jgi:hypothetical protein
MYLTVSLEQNLRLAPGERVLLSNVKVLKEGSLQLLEEGIRVAEAPE